MDSNSASKKPILLSLSFSPAMKAIFALSVVVGALLWLRQPAHFYENGISALNEFLHRRFHTNGNRSTIDLAVQAVGKLSLTAGLAIPLWLLIWQRLIASHTAGEPVARQAVKPLNFAEKLGLLFLTFVSAVLRWPPITQSLWSDEISTYNLFIRPGLWHSIAPREPVGNQPASQILSGISAAIFGVHEWSLRLPIFLVAVASVPICVLVLRRLGQSKAVAWIFGALLTLHSYHVYYSFQLKAYVLVVLLVFLSTYMLCRLWQRPNKYAWLALALCNAVLLYSHLYNALFVAAQHLTVMAWSFWIKRHPSETSPQPRIFFEQYFQGFLATLIVTAVLYLPQMQNIMLLTFDPRAPRPPLGQHLVNVFSTAHFMVGYSHWRTAAWILTGMFLVGGAFVIPRGVLKFMLSMQIAVLFLLTAAFPMRVGYYPRYLIAELPFLMLYLAMALEALWCRRELSAKFTAAGLAAGFVGLSIAAAPMVYQKIEDYRGACQLMRDVAGDRIPMYAYALGRDEFRFYDDRIKPLENREQFDRIARETSEWLMARADYPNYVADRELRALVEARCPSIGEFPGEFSISVRRCTSLH